KKLFLTAIYLIFGLISLNAFAEHKLVMEVYPGSLKMDGRYYTNDNPKIVFNWYRAKYPGAQQIFEAEEDGSGTVKARVEKNLGSEMDIDYQGAYINTPEVSTAGCGLTSSENAASTFKFSSLKEWVDKGVLRKSKFDELCKKYGYLDYRYPTVKSSTFGVSPTPDNVVSEIDYVYFNPDYIALRKKSESAAANGDMMGYLKHTKSMSSLESKLKNEYRGQSNTKESSNKKNSKSDSMDDYINSNLEYAALQKKADEAKANGQIMDQLGYRKEMRTLKKRLKKEYKANNRRPEKQKKSNQEIVNGIIKDLEEMHSVASNNQGYWKTEILMSTLPH
ncbi:MAG: hypothetical protein OEW87_15680, partial [Flavobacteriaceae bacterium]|nr:hypothetical protein [Flavobacteriaceae bacterium]